MRSPFWIVLQIFFFFLPGTFCEVMPTHYSHTRSDRQERSQSHGPSHGHPSGHVGGYGYAPLTRRVGGKVKSSAGARRASIMARLRRRFASVSPEPEPTSAATTATSHEAQQLQSGVNGSAPTVVRQSSCNLAAAAAAAGGGGGGGGGGGERFGALQRSRTHRSTSKTSKEKRPPERWWPRLAACAAGLMAWRRPRPLL